MLSARLIELIQTHADNLTRDVMKDFASNPRTRHWLGDWIGDPKEDRVQAEYEDWGRRRYRNGIPLSEIVFAVLTLKHHLRHSLREHGLVEYSRDRQAPRRSSRSTSMGSRS